MQYKVGDYVQRINGKVGKLVAYPKRYIDQNMYLPAEIYMFIESITLYSYPIHTGELARKLTSCETEYYKKCDYEIKKQKALPVQPKSFKLIF